MVDEYKVDMHYRDSGFFYYEIFFDNESQAIGYMMNKEEECEERNLFMRLLKWNERLNKYEEI